MGSSAKYCTIGKLVCCNSTNPGLAIVYLLLLGWCFVGVALVSDVFMSAIETITSKRRKIMNKKTGRQMTVSVWNETVSNLTLMALGSSAPEILLSFLELSLNEWYVGDLGPSTIIGSAAFNLLCISAVCVAAIESPNVRFIKEVPVYMITASCSVFAYMWLIVILMWSSPNVVDIWEGVLSFLFFPMLVFFSFLADKGYFSVGLNEEERSALRQSHIISADMTHEELAHIEAKIREEHGSGLTPEQVMKIMEIQYFGKHTRAFYRHQAVMRGVGGKKRPILPLPSDVRHAEQVAEVITTRDDMEKEMQVRTVEIGFLAEQFAVMESCGSVKIPVVRTGVIDKYATVRYKTRDGKAKATTDYGPADEQIVFEPGQTEVCISIKIVDDTSYEEDEEFYVDLYEPACPSQSPGQEGPPCTPQRAQLSPMKTATVLIIDDDLPGTLRFEYESLDVFEDVEAKTLNVKVERFNGCTGLIQCKYKTEENTAKAGYAFDTAKGTIKLESGQQSATIPINIRCVGHYASESDFRVILFDPEFIVPELPTPGKTMPQSTVKFDEATDGGEGECILTIKIKAGAERKVGIERMMDKVQHYRKKMAIRNSNWRQQFTNALYVGGDDSDDEDDGGEKEDDLKEEGSGPSAFDYVTHVISLPWKLLFAFCPPTDYLDGWACFVAALVMLAVVTALVGDLANLVGCALGMNNEITAITLVALGTSLPDTFASKTAAQEDPYADASIGNVTGSNSVNVFLGLGLPWTIAALIWGSKTVDLQWSKEFLPNGKFYSVRDTAGIQECCQFVVPAGSLWFNLMVFTVNAFCAISILAFRRYQYGGELGGPWRPKVMSAIFLVTQWCIYVGLSSWWATEQAR